MKNDVSCIHKTVVVMRRKCLCFNTKQKHNNVMRKSDGMKVHDAVQKKLYMGKNWEATNNGATKDSRE